MTIPLTGAGGLFTTVGRLGGWLLNFNGILGKTAPSPGSAWGASGPTINDLNDNVNNYITQLQANSNLASLTNAVYSQMRDNVRSTLLGQLNFAQTQSRQVLQALASADQSPNPFIPTPTIQFQPSLLYLINQMKTPTTTFLAPAVITATVTSGTNNHGDGVCVASVLRNDGTTQQYLFNETINLLCTSDSQISSGNLAREPFSFAGANASPSFLNWDWPAGSGASGSFSAVNAAVTSPNIVSNGDFETYTVANIPDGWTVVTGTAGTDFIKDTSEFYTGAASFAFVGTGGAPLSQLYFPIPSPVPNGVYMLNCWMRKANALATGVLQFSLMDSTNTVINNDAGNPCSFSQTLSSLTTSFAAVNGTFVLPKALPSAVRLEMKLTTGISTVGGRAAIDRMALIAPTPAYGSTLAGPYLGVFSGATPFLINDSFAVAIANDYSGLWQKLVWQLWNPGQFGYQFPTTGTTPINANLIA